MSLVRNLFAAGALIVAGFAATANAAPGNPDLRLNQGKHLVQPHLKFCFPHYERKVIYRHHYKLVVVLFVDRHCHRRVVRVYRVPNGHHYGAR